VNPTPQALFETKMQMVIAAQKSNDFFRASSDQYY
jgi:hypothetical protein